MALCDQLHRINTGICGWEHNMVYAGIMVMALPLFFTKMVTAFLLEVILSGALLLTEPVMYGWAPTNT